MWIPLLFVFLFSTGFTAAGLGVLDAGAFMLLLVRSVLTLPLLFLILYLRKHPPRWGVLLAQGQQVGVGALLHGVYLGGVFAAVKSGMAWGWVGLLVPMSSFLTFTLSRS